MAAPTPTAPDTRLDRPGPRRESKDQTRRGPWSVTATVMEVRTAWQTQMWSQLLGVKSLFIAQDRPGPVMGRPKLQGLYRMLSRFHCEIYGLARQLFHAAIYAAWS